MLKVLATHRALELLRWRNRQGDLLREAAADRGSALSEPAAAETAATGELAERLRRALARIVPEQAEVFCLCCLTDLSHREVAELRGITVNAVAVLLHRAKSRLRELLGPVAESGSGSFAARRS